MSSAKQEIHCLAYYHCYIEAGETTQNCQTTKSFIHGCPAVPPFYIRNIIPCLLEIQDPPALLLHQHLPTKIQRNIGGKKIQNVFNNTEPEC